MATVLGDMPLSDLVASERTWGCHFQVGTYLKNLDSISVCVCVCVCVCVSVCMCVCVLGLRCCAHTFSICGHWGYSSLLCMGFLLQWILLLQSMGSKCTDFSSCGAQA